MNASIDSGTADVALDTGAALRFITCGSVDVATFLLNEKRPDIQAIELRHKVTILLIPNVHLETPAVRYSIAKDN